MASIIKWGITDGVRLARSVGKYLRNPSNFTTREFIIAAERALEEKPNEWVIYYQLGDKYQSIGQYARGLQACKRCVELRPNDIRSTYALATAYNILTRADWSVAERELSDVFRILIPDSIDKFDPNLSQSELNELGMVVDTAASQAIRWFERSLQLDPDKPSKAQLHEDLSTLYHRFPHLKH